MNRYDFEWVFYYSALILLIVLVFIVAIYW